MKFPGTSLYILFPLKLLWYEQDNMFTYLDESILIQITFETLNNYFSLLQTVEFSCSAVKKRGRNHEISSDKKTSKF